MKKITLIIAIVFSGMLMQAQVLNEDAAFLKEEAGELYSNIKTFASIDWAGDHEMMVYVINKQSSALIELIDMYNLPSFDSAIRNSLYQKWAKKAGGTYVIDYEMVLHEYKKQLNAKTAY